MKQCGSKPVRELLEFGTDRPTGDVRPLNLRESHGRDMSEWPTDLRVREWPR